MRQTRNLKIPVDRSRVSDREPEKQFSETSGEPSCDPEDPTGLELDPFSLLAKRPKDSEFKDKDAPSRDAQWQAFRSARGSLEARWLLRRGSP